MRIAMRTLRPAQACCMLWRGAQWNHHETPLCKVTVTKVTHYHKTRVHAREHTLAQQNGTGAPNQPHCPSREWSHIRDWCISAASRAQPQTRTGPAVWNNCGTTVTGAGSATIGSSPTTDHCMQQQLVCVLSLRSRRPLAAPVKRPGGAITMCNVTTRSGMISPGSCLRSEIMSTSCRIFP